MISVGVSLFGAAVLGSGGSGPVTHTITASAGAHGSITPSSAVSVIEGADQPFEFSADSGYEVLSVTVDGAPVSTISPYTFVNVTEDHTIAVEFVLTETLERTYVGTSTAVEGSGPSCAAAVGELIVVYVRATVDFSVDGLTFIPTWNGEAFTVVERYWSFAGEENPGHLVAIATLRVPAGKAGTYDVLPGWGMDMPDTCRIYVEKWAGVTSGVANQTASAAGNSSTPSSGAVIPSVNHNLVLCAVARESAPAAWGAWAAGLTNAMGGTAGITLSTAYEIQTAATQRAAAKTGVTTGRWGAVIVVMSAE
jgi:hypothetical protein